jgi:hypothetical protein
MNVAWKEGSAKEARKEEYLKEKRQMRKRKTSEGTKEGR